MAKIIEEREPKAKIASYFDSSHQYWGNVDDPVYTLLEICPSEARFVSPEKITRMKI